MSSSSPQPHRLLTARLSLEQASLRDAAALGEFLARNRKRFELWMPEWPEGCEQVSSCKARIQREAIESQKGLSQRRYLRLRTNAAGPIIGTCSLFSFTENSAELGFQIDGGYEGQGYVREATIAVLSDAFERLGLARVEAISLENNSRSLRLLEQLGFQFKKPLEDFLTIDGKRYDHKLYHLTRAHWIQRCPTLPSEDRHGQKIGEQKISEQETGNEESDQEEPRKEGGSK